MGRHCWLSLGSRHRPITWTSSGNFVGVIPAQCWQCWFSSGNFVGVIPAQCWFSSGSRTRPITWTSSGNFVGVIPAQCWQCWFSSGSRTRPSACGPDPACHSYPELAKVRQPDSGQVISSGMPDSGRHWTRQIWLPGKLVELLFFCKRKKETLLTII